MATLASLIVKVGADTRDLTKGLNKGTSRLKAFNKDILTARNAMVLFAGAAGAGLAAKKLFDLGASVEETASAYRTILGPAIETTNAFLDEFANKAGLSRREGQELSLTVASIAQGMGFTSEASAKLANEIITLGGDLASLRNIGTERAVNALTSALTGEREQLKSLGTIITEVEIMERVRLTTGKESISQITQQDKATAFLALTTQKMGLIVGDLNRTQTSAANRSKQLGATLRDLADTFAVALQPAFAVVFEELSGGVDGMKSLTDAVSRSAPVIAAWANVAVQAFKLFASTIAAPIRLAFNLGQIIGNLGSALFALITGDLRGFAEAAEDMKGNLGDMGDAILNVTEGMFDFAGAFRDAFFAFPAAIEETKNLNAELATTSQRVLPALRSGLVRLSPAWQGTIDQTRKATAELRAYVEEASAASRISNVLGKALGVAGFLGGLGPVSGILGKASGFLGLNFFDHGGSIPSGGVGIVGEKGPELVSGPARVTSRTETAAMMGGDMVFNFIFEQDGVEVRRITKRQQRNDSLGLTHRLALPAPSVG